MGQRPPEVNWVCTGLITPLPGKDHFTKTSVATDRDIEQRVRSLQRVVDGLRFTSSYRLKEVKPATQ